MTDAVESRGAPRESPSTWVRLLRARAQEDGDLRVCTFLADGEVAGSSLTYAQLDGRARAIAAGLQSRHPREARALLLYSPGLEYVAALFGCLYAGIVAVPVAPPHPARLEPALPRLSGIVGDVRPDVVMTTTAGLDFAPALASRIPALRSLPWLRTDEGLEEAGNWQDPCVDGDAIALIQYTSGSTAAPKGVVLTHGNTLHNSGVIQEALGHTLQSVGVIWLPPYHDMGLVGGILQPIFLGFPVVLMSPIHFLQRPLRWLTAISRHRATTTAGPNFAYDLCVRRTTPEQRARLDLRSLESAVVGAEPIDAGTLERFTAAFAPCGFRREAFRPGYGLAESTLMVTSRPGLSTVGVNPRADTGRVEIAAASEVPQGSASRDMVSCGWPRLGQTAIIVDPETRTPCPPDTIGEVWVSGPSTGVGYWDRPEETEATFRARLADTRQGPFLRTGDLGFAHQGELFITGRLKDLLIIRGRNHHPIDIEWTATRSHPALRPGGGVAFSISTDGAEQLIIVHEAERQHRRHGHGAITDAIRRAVIEQHDLLVASVLLVTPASLPRTSNGKIRRSACRESFLAGTLDVLQPSRTTGAPDDA